MLFYNEWTEIINNVESKWPVLLFRFNAYSLQSTVAAALEAYKRPSELRVAAWKGVRSYFFVEDPPEGGV